MLQTQLKGWVLFWTRGLFLKTLFIINPIAGRNKSKIIWNDIKSHINIPFDYAFTQTPGDARRFAHEAYSQGFKRVVAVGGDGTVSKW